MTAGTPDQVFYNDLSKSNQDKLIPKLNKNQVVSLTRSNAPRMVMGNRALYLSAVMRRANALPDSFLVSYASNTMVVLHFALTS
jgi:hypothetical protein